MRNITVRFFLGVFRGCVKHYLATNHKSYRLNHYALRVGVLGFTVVLVGGAANDERPSWLNREVAWLNAYDFDGDGKPDRIGYEYSGGAHCCYQVNVTLSSRGKTVKVPFQMDGGYAGGLDLSQPDHFTVRTTDHGLPELLMEIETYNAKPLPLDRKLMRRYGFRTHRIAVCFAGGRMKIRDLTPQAPPCRATKSQLPKQ